MKNRRSRQTKIVATLGPSSSSHEMIRKLFLTGVDVFRLNFSHGSADGHRQNTKFIREIEAELDAPIGVLADLQGPKLRVGRFKEGKICLEKGMVLQLDLDEAEGDETRVNLPHPEIISAVSKDDLLLMDDGKVRMKIVEKSSDLLKAEVVAGVKLSNNKGVNVPGVVLPIAALTEKDREDLEVALDMGADWIAQSFVQKPEDVQEAKDLIAGRAALMAKIEKPSAVESLDEILSIVDGIMLARGDLGVEIPPEDVPSVQKRIVRRVRHVGKPIIVATQMLESMIENPSPTRAEASDVATAVYDGTDAVMLSAETAAGQYPVEAVQIMDRLCIRTEEDPLYRRIIEEDSPRVRDDPGDAITAAACAVAQNIKAACIANYTTSGGTTLRTVHQRPSVPILSLSHSERVARRLSLSYGVRPQPAEEVQNTHEAIDSAKAAALASGLADKGDRLVLTAGIPFGKAGSTNILRIAVVD